VVGRHLWEQKMKLADEVLLKFALPRKLLTRKQLSLPG